MSDALHQLTDPFLTLEMADEAATAQLAEDIAAAIAPGDLICLSGDLGAGKSTFARALLRAFADEPDLEVPSPTFTLVQTYGFDRFDISHFDLYRLEEPDELAELGLEDLLQTGVVLIEWPEMGGDHLSAGALWLQFSDAANDGDIRQVKFASADTRWRDRIGLTLDVRAFLGKAECGEHARRFLAGDASLRSFENVRSGSESAVLMKWPFQNVAAVSPAVSAYMSKVHLARDCRSVLAIGGELRHRGFAAPSLFASDLQRGFLLLEDLGGETIAPGGIAKPDRYHVAINLIAHIHDAPFPKTVPVQDGSVYTVPEYSQDALLAEAELFLDWYVPEATGADADDNEREAFRLMWTSTFQSIEGAERGWVLRDFHSPNLLWRANRTGTDQIGLIDFQDTVIGPLAYDVGSLLFDARTDISATLENELLDAYLNARRKLSSGFDEKTFLSAFAVMSAQRITKILGIFVRLARRDGKSGYLDHLPRMISYLKRVLEQSDLTELGSYYSRYLD